MANISFPAAGLMSMDISLEWPGQSIHESLYTGDRQVITRGVGMWTGRVIWDVRSRTTQDAEIRQINAFLHQLEGAANTFDVPLPDSQSDRYPDGTELTVSAFVRTGSTMRLTCNQQEGLAAGDYIVIDNFLFQLVTSLIGGSMLVSPYRPITLIDDAGQPAPATARWLNPYLRARRTSSTAVSNNIDVDWAGPWSVDIVGV